MIIHPGDIEKSAGIAVLVVFAIYAAMTVGVVLGMKVWNAVRSQRPIEDADEKLIGPPHRIMSVR